MAAKGPEAFRTISEASDELGVPQHVLRFWETKFSFIRPMKRAGGRRLYRPQDLAVLKSVQRLLHEQGYTIKGVQRLHKEHGLKRLVAGGGEDPSAVDALGDAAPDDGAASAMGGGARAALERALAELEAAKARLDALLIGDAAS